jgi:integrase
MARGRDGLYRRGKSYAFRYKDTDDKWREKCCGSSDRQTARDFRNDFLADLKEGMLPTKMADWRVDQAEEWWNGFRRPLIAEGTNRSEPYIVRHLRRIIGDKRLKEITNQDIDRYVSTRLAGYEYQAGDESVKMGAAGAWSINKEVRLWAQILRKAKLWQRLSHDYRPLKTKVSDVGESLTREELRHLADTARSDVAWEAAFYGSVLAANTGLRGGEIKKLRIGSIDLENRRLRILRGDAKSDASARTIELNRDACEAAARLIFRAS